MRDPPESASVSEAHVCHSETLSVRRAEVGLVSRQLRVPPPHDEPIPVDAPATGRVAKRLATVLFRALAAWPT